MTYLCLGPFKCFVTHSGRGGGVKCPRKSATKVYGSMLLALRGGEGCRFSRKKRFITVECPLMFHAPGLMRCGPAPLAAIKQGQTYIPHDSGFVFAEVNGEKIHWLVMYPFHSTYM